MQPLLALPLRSFPGSHTELPWALSQLQRWDFMELKMQKGTTLFSFNFSVHRTGKD